MLHIDPGHGLSIKFAQTSAQSRRWAKRYVGGSLHEPVLTAHVLEHLRPGDTFVDVGAHLGWFSLMAAARGADVYAFELQAGLAPLIEESVALNGFERAVRVIPAGVGSSCGLVPYRRESLSAAKGVAVASDEDVRYAPCLTLDAALEGVRPALIKIDVEGFEGHVLEGARETLARHRPALMIELHDVSESYGHSIPAVLEMLTGLGYEIERYGSHRRPEAAVRSPLPPERFGGVKNDSAVFAQAGTGGS